MGGLASVARRLGKAVIALLLLVVAALALFRLLAAWREDETALPPTSTLIATPLGQVAAELSGPADGPPILLNHGTAAWSGFWRDIATHLADEGWRVIAVDLPPFGYSGHDPAARYDRVNQAERLSALLRQVSAKPAVVVGHSFGAGAATELALRHPRQVSRLVLVDAALGELDRPGGPGFAERAMAVRPLAEVIAAATITNPLATGALLRSFVAKKDMVAPWVPTIQQPMRRAGTTSAYAAWLPALFATQDRAWSRSSLWLQSIAVPVALIWGAADTVTPPDQGRRIAALTHAESFRLLKDVGHIPHIEAPSAFIAALDAAIAQGGVRQ